MPGFDKFDDLKRDDLHLRSTGQSASEESLVPASSHAVSAEKLVGETIDGRYQLLSMIGEGGMGRVYKAKQLLTGRIVALKMLPAKNTSDATHLMRFQQEARAACAINHPNAVSVYDFGITPEHVPYIAMQYVEGPTLAEEIAQRKVISERFAVQIFEQISDALEHAHDHRVLHRDIKPSNIMIVPDKKLGRKAMLLDFGIAKLEDEGSNFNITQTGEVFGTPFYMSPEQCQGIKLDNRADIYSLGCVMFEALTGAPPFTGDNFLQIVYRHVHEPAPPVVNRVNGKPISENLTRIVSKCLEKDPAKRFQSMSELHAALENVAGPSAGPKPHKPPQEQQHKKGKPIAAIIIVTCCTILAFAAYLLHFDRGPVQMSSPSPTASTVSAPGPTPSNWHDAYKYAKDALDHGNTVLGTKFLEDAFESTKGPENKLARIYWVAQLKNDANESREKLPKMLSDASKSDDKAGDFQRFISKGVEIEPLLTTLIDHLPPDDNDLQKEEFELAQLYSDLASTPGIPQQMKNQWYESAQAEYDRLSKPSDPYVFHQHATFLLRRAESLRDEYSKEDPDRASPEIKKAASWANESLDLLSHCIQRNQKLGSGKTGQQIADCHFWRGYAYCFLRNFKSAQWENEEAQRLWENDDRSAIYSGFASICSGRADDAYRLGDRRKQREYLQEANRFTAMANAEQDRIEKKNARAKLKAEEDAKGKLKQK